MALLTARLWLALLMLAVLFSGNSRSVGGEAALIQTLKAPDAATEAVFGWSVALDLPYLLVGAPNNGDGASYVFKKMPNGGLYPWVYETTLTPAALSTNARLGFSVSLHGFEESLDPVGPRIAVGAPFSSTTFTAEGAVYLFDADWNEVSKLTASFPEAGELYGYSVSMSTEYLAVGSPFDDAVGLSGGAVFLYIRDVLSVPATFRWQLLETKFPPDNEHGGRYGSAVAVDGAHLVVGAPLGDTASGIDVGSAVIYYRDAGGANHWNAVKRLGAVDAQRDSGYAEVVAVDENVVAVGAPRERVSPGSRSGAVHLYGRNVGGKGQWGLIRRIVASDSENGAGFGFSLSLSEGVLAVGAPGHTADSKDVARGSVYLYGEDEGGPGQWGEIGRINLPMGYPVGGFGVGLELEGSVLAGASPYADTAGVSQSGTVSMLHVPQLALPPGNLIVDGSFGPSFYSLNRGLPDQTGEWSSNKTVRVVDTETIPDMSAPDGSHMVQFLATGSLSNPTASENCELYQLVDLTPYALRVSSGNVVARLAFEANRIAGDAQTDDRFSAALLSFDGDPADFPTEVFNLTGFARGSTNTDASPATWQSVTAELQVPARTTYLAVLISANENVFNDVAGSEFDGHYADNVSLSLRAEPESPEVVEMEMLPISCDILIRYVTEPGFHYNLQKSTGLADWTKIRWGMTGTGAEQTIIFAGGLISRTFYRIGVEW